ncbi:hypothetical protein QTP81_10390 [Alteromonas sp. ASW11-36]|uniref:Lipoprotein n=1 Tax=Alteromonas arenosi TaxID=3055817 RepID=A0ABT7SXU0_9ALTE|nr:hypothetical protein [Alteromonas sp. ASW11-36]MDM7861006.1 hypothetical protein [Alteromonas sp. ASW11-36]
MSMLYDTLKLSITAAIVVSVTSGCSSNNFCEDILEVQRQEQMCQELAQIMRNNRYPQQALTARKRFETECTELRYYRDDYDTICKGDQQPIGATRREKQP